MKKGAEQWAKSRKIYDALTAKVDAMKLQATDTRVEVFMKRKDAGVSRRKSRRSITNG